jgi:hypothetical protein
MKNSIHIKPGKLDRTAAKWWRTIMAEWQHVHRTYYLKSHYDKAWCFNERASVSMLSAAVWKAGGIAIEEYVTRKQHENETKPGRVDLWFKIGKNFAAVVEAKHVKKSERSFAKQELSAEVLEKIHNTIDAAIIDVKKSIGDEPHGYAIVFLELYESNKANADDSNLFHLLSQINCDFYAYVNCQELAAENRKGVLLGRRYVK